MARRWYIVVVGLLLTVGVAWGAYQATPPEYQARGLVLLLPGANAVAEGGNPFLALSGLEQPASIVVAYFASTAAQAEVAEVSETADFSVQLDSSTRGPVIAVEVTDTSAEGAITTLDYLTQRVPQELDRLQSEVGAPAASVITSMPLVIDDKPEADTSGTIRITIAALAAGIAVTGIATFTLDGVLLRRRQRRRAQVAAKFGAVAEAHDPVAELEHEDGDPIAAVTPGPDPDPAPEADTAEAVDADHDDDLADQIEHDVHTKASASASRSARNRASDPGAAATPREGKPRVDSRVGRHR